jgi:3-methylcrotonyl-CoA carboxylase beta subunit
MIVLKSGVNTQTEEFKSNYKYNKSLIKSIQTLTKTNRYYRDEQILEQYRKKGKLPVHERINLLTDEKSYFLEFSPLAANDKYDNKFPGAGIVTGLGLINGMETIIVANDATVKGGTYVYETIKKHLRAQEIALQNNLPIVYLVDSGGIYLPEQANVYPDSDHFGRIFYNQAKLSAERIPQVAVVLGSCTAGGAYIPAMSDESIIVRETGSIFLAGPPLVKAATGEIVTAEELGGAIVHTSISGVADHLAENEEDALLKCRDIFDYLNKSQRQSDDRAETVEPLFPVDDIYGMIPQNLKRAFNMYGIIARLVDGSCFQEFKANYGKSIITGFARIMGYNVGIIANNGILFPESTLKATHFIELCCSRNIPMIFLQNIAGFMVGKEYEHKGIAKDGAKMIQAVATANVPKFTVIVGGSSGAGNYAMAGRAYKPNLLFIWPNSKTSVMGGEQAADVLISIKQRNNENNDTLTVNETKLKQKILGDFETESSALFSTSRLWDDGIIDPADTRKILAIAISMSLNKPFPEPKTGVYRM